MGNCKIHGNLLTYAITRNYDYIGLDKALKHPDKDYYCPGCGIALYPERGTKMRSRDLFRKGHFNKFPRKKSLKDFKAPSDLDSLVNFLALKLKSDFDDIYKDGIYHSEIKKGEVWVEMKRNHPVAIYARRYGEYPIDAVIHAFDFPFKNVNDIYYSFKEIAQERFLSSKKRRFLETEEGCIELPKKIYQNLIVLKNEFSFKKQGRKLVLAPSLYNFVAYFTNSINYFDKDKSSIVQVFLTDGFNTTGKDPSLMFSYYTNELLDFSFDKMSPVYKKKELKNMRGVNSVFIPEWKLAELTYINVDQTGKPVYVVRLDGQHQMLL